MADIVGAFFIMVTIWIAWLIICYMTIPIYVALRHSHEIGGADVAHQEDMVWSAAFQNQ